MTERERLDRIADTVARIDERTEIIMQRQKRDTELMDVLADKVSHTEARTEACERDRSRLWKLIIGLTLSALAALVNMFVSLFGK